MATVFEFRSDTDRSWAEFWSEVTAPIRAGWAGVPGLDDAITRAEPVVKQRWLELFAPMDADFATTPPAGLNQQQVDEMSRVCTAIGQQIAAAFNSRLHAAAASMAFETLRAESGWREAQLRTGDIG
jgi:hypothetical protein